MFTTPEITCNVFSFLDKDQIERIQLVNQFWNNVIIRHKNILPLRHFVYLFVIPNRIHLTATKDVPENIYSYTINFDGKNLSKIKEDEEEEDEEEEDEEDEEDEEEEDEEEEDEEDEEEEDEEEEDEEEENEEEEDDEEKDEDEEDEEEEDEEEEDEDEEDKEEEDVSSRYSQLTVDEVLTNLNDVIFDYIQIKYCRSEDSLNNLLNMMKLVTTKTESRFRGRFGQIFAGRYGSKMFEIFGNYIIVDELALGYSDSSNRYIREVCANPEIVQWPSTTKEIRLGVLKFKANNEVLNLTCNGKLNGANRVTVEFKTSDVNCGDFIRQWFKVCK
uniref:F-box domain-containing protein n=1 Tax=Acrobeloides nanus TaxID=290746 RepID=A0A914DWT7_9BILA